MLVKKTNLQDVLVITPSIHYDGRGSFCESFHHLNLVKNLGIEIYFVQDSLIYSNFGVLRGMHYQVGESAQYKLIQVLQGKIFDVAVDVRENSSTLYKWVGIELSNFNRKQLLIPPGFAHGFLSLTDSIVMYKTDKYLDKFNSRRVKWNDPMVGITWPFIPTLMSSKDK